MAHELDRNAQTGIATMFSVIETPWHKEGRLLTAAPTFEEALALAGVNYEVQLREIEVAAKLAGPGPVYYVRSPIGRVVVRADRWPDPASILAVVGNDYSVVQNRESFEVLEPLIDSGVATLETGGTLRGGKDAWLLVKFKVDDPVVQEVFAGEVVPFGMVHANHGSRASYLMLTPIRVVCANTLGMAHEGRQVDQYVKVVHRGGARIRLVEAAERMFSGIVERYKVIALQYSAMKARILTVDEFTASVLDTLAPLPEASDVASSRGFTAAMNRAETRRTTLRLHWEGGRGHAGDHSAWEAYNGAIETLDHEEGVFTVRGSRVESMLMGRLQDQKQKVADAIYALCRN